MEIVYHPHPALGWKSTPVQRIDSGLRKTVEAMFELMYESKGIGLAANQVALPYRLFIMNATGEPGDKDHEFVFINPEIMKRSGQEEGEEGCLSLPEVYGPVTRSTHITVSAFDLSGNEFVLELEALPARVVQHEADHLDGVMFTDRMAAENKAEIEDVLERFEADFRRNQSGGTIAADDELKKKLRELAETQA